MHYPAGSMLRSALRGKLHSDCIAPGEGSEHAVQVVRKPALSVRAVDKMNSGSMVLVYSSRLVMPITARGHKQIPKDSIVVKNLYMDNYYTSPALLIALWFV